MCTGRSTSTWGTSILLYTADWHGMLMGQITYRTDQYTTKLARQIIPPSPTGWIMYFYLQAGGRLAAIAYPGFYSVSHAAFGCLTRCAEHIVYIALIVLLSISKWCIFMMFMFAIYVLSCTVSGMYGSLSKAKAEGQSRFQLRTRTATLFLSDTISCMLTGVAWGPCDSTMWLRACQLVKVEDK